MVRTVVSEQGLRQRKKVRTRREIYEAAHRLFARQSFDAVTVAAVARAARLSQASRRVLVVDSSEVPSVRISS
jgi:tetracycline repressor-like protein